VGPAGGVAVQDAENPYGNLLLYSRSAWVSFVSAAQLGQSDAVHWR
jgi:hypothetical protein